MNLTLADILLFLRDYGLPITILITIIITGARGLWYFKSYVTDMKAQADKSLEELKAQFAERIADKNALIEGWQKQAQQNGAATAASVAFNQEMLERTQELTMLTTQLKEALNDLRTEVRTGRRASGSTR